MAKKNSEKIQEKSADLFCAGSVAREFSCAERVLLCNRALPKKWGGRSRPIFAAGKGLVLDRRGRLSLRALRQRRCDLLVLGERFGLALERHVEHAVYP